jgi:hypothetical protein
MTPLDDDLLTALHEARPAPGYQPTADSPEATALLTRILAEPRHPAPRRVTRRRVLLAAAPVAAGVAAAAVLADSLASSGPGISVGDVRTAVLDAFERSSGDIVQLVRTYRLAAGPVMTQQAWTYPAFAVPGQRVRFRLFQSRDGVPQEDTESIYVQDQASAGLSMSTDEGPRSAETTDVWYPDRTWFRGTTSSVLLAGGLSPAVIRDQVADGGFTVVGTTFGTLELTWSRTIGARTSVTTLWVDARTYLPLRSVSTARRGPGAGPVHTISTDYQVLPATTANLGLLTPPIPAGFRRTATSARF